MTGSAIPSGACMLGCRGAREGGARSCARTGARHCRLLSFPFPQARAIADKVAFLFLFLPARARRAAPGPCPSLSGVVAYLVLHILVETPSRVVIMALPFAHTGALTAKRLARRERIVR